MTTHARLGFLVMAFAAVACGGRIADPPGSGTDPVGGLTTDAGSGAESNRSVATSTPESTPASPGTLDCLGDPAAIASPDDFVAMSWNREHAGCDTSSRCTAFVDLDASCALWVQADDVPRTIVMDPADCLALKRWFTSARLLGGLRDLGRCAGDPWTGNPEATMVTLASSGAVGGKYEKTCEVEPFGENRACLQKALDIYAPDVRLVP